MPNDPTKEVYKNFQKAIEALIEKEQKEQLDHYKKAGELGKEEGHAWMGGTEESWKKAKRLREKGEEEERKGDDIGKQVEGKKRGPARN